MNDDLHHADDSYGYLREALEKNNLAYEPPGFGRRFRTPMFEFVRRVKAHPRFESLAAMDALKLVGDVLAQGKPETADDWKTLFHDSDDPRAEFIDTWDRIKWPRASVEHAQYEAKRLPLKPLICPSDEYAVFVSVAGIYSGTYVARSFCLVTSSEPHWAVHPLR